ANRKNHLRKFQLRRNIPMPSGQTANLPMPTPTQVGIWPVESARRSLSLWFCAALMLTQVPAIRGQIATQEQSLQKLKELSIEELMDLEITTASRKEERWWSAPAGVDI